jgi:hypothetical protein
MIEDLCEEIAFELAEEGQRVFRNLELFSPSEEFHGLNIDLLQVDLASPENFSGNEVSFFVHSTDLDNFVR